MVARGAGYNFWRTMIRWRFNLLRLAGVHYLFRKEMRRPPIVVGALGGSGTRGVVDVLQSGGVWMGTFTGKETRDAQPFYNFGLRWFPALLAASEEGAPLPKELLRWFESAVQQHLLRVPNPASRWGLKHPFTMWYIPLLARRFAGMKFVHLVRDGRDMALSSNNHLLRYHRESILAGGQGLSNEAAQLAIWAKGNGLAHQRGRALLGDKYLLVRYEDLCGKAEETVERIYRFAGLDYSAALVAETAARLRPSPGIGRWERSSDPVVHRLDDQTRAALRDLGYQV